MVDADKKGEGQGDNAKDPEMLHVTAVHENLTQSPAAAELTPRLPQEKEGSHYYAAREAEADFVRVDGKNGEQEVEKYLFYRGVGCQNPSTPTA